MAASTLPLSYDECRARFLRVAHEVGAAVERHPIAALGPEGQRLTIDVAIAGDAVAPNRLFVMSGVHGVEAFAPSAIQCALLQRAGELPAEVAVVLVHAVNPWGVAWWRRQNESNVDLNRNWARDEGEPPANAGYDQLHALLAPDTRDLPTAQSFLDPVATLIERHGLGWVRDAVSRGQYRHADGLYFGGHGSEQSTVIVAGVATRHLGGAERVLTVDLHTGYGAFGTVTLLSHRPTGSADDQLLRRWFPGEHIVATVDDQESTSPPKVGQLSIGVADVLPATEYQTVTLELGTVGETRMILAERAEHWVHRHGDRANPEHAAAVWEHRVCSTPDDRAWEETALEHGRRVLRAAITALASPRVALGRDAEEPGVPPALPVPVSARSAMPPAPPTVVPAAQALPPGSNTGVMMPEARSGDIGETPC